VQGLWPSETSEPPNEGRTTTPTLPPPGPLRPPAIGGLDVVDTFTAAVSVTAKKARPFWLVTIC
jgi:hypothetical protein